MRLLLTLTIGIFLILPYSAEAQNLLPNPSFENFQNCPTTTTSGLAAPDIDDWEMPVNHVGTPDVYNSCHTGGIVGVPNNLLGTQNALTGNGYIGLYASRVNTPVREYVGATLSAPMQAGFTYRVVCNYSLADDCQLAADGFGVHFSTGQLTTTVGNQDILNITPSYLHTSVMTERNTWGTVTFDYVAQGGEDYFTMGFFLDDNTINLVSQGTFPRNESYYYFDDVSVVELPVSLNAGPDREICQGDQTVLTATGDGPIWWSALSTPATSIGTGPTLSVTPQTTASYIAHNNLTTDTVEVTVSTPVAVNLGPDTVLCPGSTLTLQNDAALAQWQDGSGGNTYTVTETGRYRLTVQNGACQSSDEILVEVATRRDFAPDSTLCLGKTLYLDAYPYEGTTGMIATTYEWMDGNTEQTRRFSTAQSISVTSESRCGRQTRTLNLAVEDCDCYLYIPSAFTPDADGVNDIFKPSHICTFATYQLEIFDRWGKEVFSTRDPDTGWDGGADGFYVENGLYNYLVTYRLEDGLDDREITGSVTLVR